MESDCSPDSPECICPCRCGCQNDINSGDIPFVNKLNGKVIPVGEIGICASCGIGIHEIRPGDLTDEIDLHMSVLKQLFEEQNKRQ